MAGLAAVRLVRARHRHQLHQPRLRVAGVGQRRIGEWFDRLVALRLLAVLAQQLREQPFAEVPVPEARFPVDVPGRAGEGEAAAPIEREQLRGPQAAQRVVPACGEE